MRKLLRVRHLGHRATSTFLPLTLVPYRHPNCTISPNPTGNNSMGQNDFRRMKKPSTAIMSTLPLFSTDEKCDNVAHQHIQSVVSN